MNPEEFFGFGSQMQTPPSKTEVKKAVTKKIREAEKLQNKTDKTPEQKEMVDYFEQMGLIPAQRKNPEWKAKKAQTQNSIMDALSKITGSQIKGE